MELNNSAFGREKISVENILQLQVSCQPNAWSPLSKEISIREVLTEIRNGSHAKQIDRLRSLLNSGDAEGYSSHKKNLAAVTFCGTFNKARKKAALKKYNYLIVLDIDKLSEDELQRVKECFFKDDLVFAFWESPSQKGIKGLVHLNFSTEPEADKLDKAHKIAFSKLSSHFLEKYKIELDSNGSDTTRLCFFSNDPHTVIKEEAVSFEISETEILATSEPKEKTERVNPIHKSDRDALYNPKDRNRSLDRKTIQAIIKFLNKKGKSITSSYADWYRVSLAIANAFTHEIGEKYFLKLSVMDKEKFNETNCKNMLLNSYEIQTGKIKFNTIVYLANEQGYKTKHQKEESSEAANESVSQVSSS